MQKKWILLTLAAILLAVLLVPVIFTLYVNISHASIYYEVSVTGLENRTASAPVTILVPLPLIRDTVAVPEEKSPAAANGWNISLVETEHGPMLSLTSTEPVLRNPDLSIRQYFPSAFDVQVTNASQLHFSTENRSSRTAWISLSGLTLPEKEKIVIDISFQTSSKYEDLLMQPNSARGLYRLLATATIPGGTDDGWSVVSLTTDNTQPQIPDPYPTPIPTAQPASAEDPGFWISNTDQYLSYWNEKMGWNFTGQTLAGYSKDLSSYLDTTAEKEAAGYHITNNSEYLHAVKDILGLTAEQFDAFVTADAEQKNKDRIQHHSQSSWYSDAVAAPA